jgi:hypothetical protein
MIVAVSVVVQLQSGQGRGAAMEGQAGATFTTGPWPKRAVVLGCPGQVPVQVGPQEPPVRRTTARGVLRCFVLPNAGGCLITPPYAPNFQGGNRGSIPLGGIEAGKRFACVGPLAQ